MGKKKSANGTSMKRSRYEVGKANMEDEKPGKEERTLKENYKRKSRTESRTRYETGERERAKRKSRSIATK